MHTLSFQNHQNIALLLLKHQSSILTSLIYGNFKKISRIESMTGVRLTFASSKGINKNMRQVNFDVINFIVSSFLIIKKIIIYCVKVIYFFQYPFFHQASMKSIHYIHKALIADVLSLLLIMHYSMVFLINP